MLYILVLIDLSTNNMSCAFGLINETEKDLLLLTGECFHRKNKIDLENRNNLEDSARLTRKH